MIFVGLAEFRSDFANWHASSEVSMPQSEDIPPSRVMRLIICVTNEESKEKQIITTELECSKQPHGWHIFT